MKKQYVYSLIYSYSSDPFLLVQYVGKRIADGMVKNLEFSDRHCTEAYLEVVRFNLNDVKKFKSLGLLSNNLFRFQLYMNRYKKRFENVASSSRQRLTD